MFFRDPDPAAACDQDGAGQVIGQFVYLLRIVPCTQFGSNAVVACTVSANEKNIAGKFAETVAGATFNGILSLRR